MPYIHTINLNTGAQERCERDAIHDRTLAIVQPWLRELVATGQRQALPVAPLAHYSAAAFTHESGGLVVTIYAPTGPHLPGKPALSGTGNPLVTIGIAQRSRHGAELWAMLNASFSEAIKPGLRCPRPPWMAVAVHVGIMDHLDSTQWLAGLEVCIAWAWMTHKPDIRLA